MKTRNIVLIIIIVFLAFLAIGLTACRSVSKLHTTSHTDSIVSINRDTVYHRYDSAGHTYTKETIREYYRDTTIFQPILTKEIIREAGQIVFINSDSGKASKKDTVIVIKDVRNNSTQRTNIPLKYIVVGVAIGILFVLLILAIKNRIRSRLKIPI